MSDFLRILDATVGRDGTLPNLEGHLVVAVRKKESREFVYWHAAMTKTTMDAGFVDGIPIDTTAILLIDESDSETLLSTGGLPEAPSLYAIEGDRTLLARFSRRYFSRNNWLSVRGGQPS